MTDRLFAYKEFEYTAQSAENRVVNDK